jgi:hypothetical protein
VDAGLSVGMSRAKTIIYKKKIPGLEISAL